MSKVTKEIEKLTKEITELKEQAPAIQQKAEESAKRLGEQMFDDIISKAEVIQKQSS